LIFSGHEDGTLRAWSLDTAEAAAPPLRVSDCPVTAVAVEEATGFVWAGCEEGGVVVVRCVGGWGRGVGGRFYKAWCRIHSHAVGKGRRMARLVGQNLFSISHSTLT